MIEIMMELKPDGKRALYEQIYEYIRNEIADGKISGRKNYYRLLVYWREISR